jgi:hypothetical protein
MIASERLSLELHEIEHEIEDLEELRDMLELCPRPEGVWGLSRAVRVYFLRRDLERRMHFLKMRRNSAFACYRHVHGGEGMNRPLA